MEDKEIQKWLDNADKGIAEGKPQYVLASSNRLQRLGRKDLAEKVLRDGYDIFSDSIEVFRALATAIREKDPQEGLTFADEALPSFGNAARFQRTLALADLQRVPKAIKEIEEILRDDPHFRRDRFVVTKLFDLYNDESRFQEARELLEPLIDQGVYTDVRMKQLLSTVLCKLRKSLPKVLELLQHNVDPQSERLKQRARDIVGEIPVPSPSPPRGAQVTAPRVFISHSSQDEKVAAALVELLGAALSLESADIRCTSVPGYKLPTGAHTSTQLREEINGAEVVMGIVTTYSIQSSYVLFELGASWGLGKPTFPLLARGAEFSIIPGPMRERHASMLNVRAEIQQVIDDLVVSTSIKRRSGVAARVEGKIEILLAAASESP